MNPDEKSCPFCAEVIKAEATICRFCKSQLGLSVPQVQTAPPPKSGGFPVWAILLIIGVVTIPVVAIVAAIAIPGLIKAQGKSNERNASASLKTVATAQADFRSNDRDCNRVMDFWTGDIAGLYCIDNSATGPSYPYPIKLIEVSVALADFDPKPGLHVSSGWGDKGAGETDVYGTSISTYGVQSSKAGYWYMALSEDLQVTANGDSGEYRQNTGAAREAKHNRSRFGVAALPGKHGSGGKNVFIINEGNTMFKRDFRGDVVSDSAIPPRTTGKFNGNWPTDFSLTSEWTKFY